MSNTSNNQNRSAESNIPGESLARFRKTPTLVYDDTNHGCPCTDLKHRPSGPDEGHHVFVLAVLHIQTSAGLDDDEDCGCEGTNNRTDNAPPNLSLIFFVERITTIYYCFAVALRIKFSPKEFSVLGDAPA
jgi:hypothetical protein